jgi:hypothetical protein
VASGAVCGPSRGHYGRPWRIDGPQGIKRWMNDEERAVRAPKRVRCDGPKHWGRRCWYPREECYVQKWVMNKQAFKQAVRAYDIFSLTMPSRVLCPACAKEAPRG